MIDDDTAENVKKKERMWRFSGNPLCRLAALGIFLVTG